MKKNVVKMITVILIAILLITFLNTISFSDYYDIGAFENEEVNNKASTMIVNASKNSIATARIVSGAIALIVLLVIAMKYMMAAPGDKADIKKHAVAYVIGAFILFSVTEIITILIEVGGKIGEESAGE